jgi:hypothetical protein
MIAITGIHFVLAGLALFGFLPLAMILYKKNRVKKILTTGEVAEATIYEIRTVLQAPRDIVYYSFNTPRSDQPYTGRLTTGIGEYKKGDVLDIYYLPGNPRRNTIKGAWGSYGMVVFGIVIALAVLFAVYKLNEMIQNGQI